MSNEDILVLAKAGFNVTQIAALNQLSKGTQPNQTPAGNVNNTMQQAANPNDMMQFAQLLMAQQPRQETVDDILASVIAPPSNPGNGGK